MMPIGIELLVAAVLRPGATMALQGATPWERYRLVIVATIVLMLVKLALIVRLLIERRQRLRAQSATEQQISYVAHMSRVATVGELTASLAHELRQPLASIRYNAETAIRLLEKQESNHGEVKELLDQIAAHDAQAAEVIDRVVSLLRREDRPVERVDLNAVCEGVGRLLRSAATARQATVEFALDRDLPPIEGDAVQLQQVVLNLVLNALEALSSRDGARTVVVATAKRGDAVELSVRDSGPGVATDVAPRLFEPFFSTKSQGLGMGLVIVRSIVEKHGGSVDAQNHPLGGAAFRVVLPRDVARREQLVATPAAQR